MVHHTMRTKPVVQFMVLRIWQKTGPNRTRPSLFNNTYRRDRVTGQEIWSLLEWYHDAAGWAGETKDHLPLALHFEYRDMSALLVTYSRSRGENACKRSYGVFCDFVGCVHCAQPCRMRLHLHIVISMHVLRLLRPPLYLHTVHNCQQRLFLSWPWYLLYAYKVSMEILVSTDDIEYHDTRSDPKWGTKVWMSHKSLSTSANYLLILLLSTTNITDLTRYIRRASKHPVAQGGFGDIWKGILVIPALNGCTSKEVRRCLSSLTIQRATSTGCSSQSHQISPLEWRR